jgi:hypothetical protein
MIATMTRPRMPAATIQDILNRQVDIVALTETGNLDAVSETAKRAVRPAGPAVLGNVLVERVRQKGDPVHVAPGKRVLS